MKIATLHSLFLESTGICTDTRKLKEGNMYVALKGANFNGNAFAKAALENGASYAIIDESQYESEQTILVSDGLTCLQELATYHRMHLGLPIIALTGSNGKTTTKELINAVLSLKFNTTATLGNLNNHIGVPLTLLAMDTHTEIGIVEMGANHQREIAGLCQIAQPNYGYITNFGKAHLEGFGGIEGVIKGKSELYDYLRASGGIAFINSDDPKQLKQSEGVQRVTFGAHTADYVIAHKGADPFVSIQTSGIDIQSQLVGDYNGTNVSAAVSIGRYLDVELSAIKRGVEGYFPANNRSQIIQKENFKIILDAYNANPTSMEAALRNLSAQTADKRVAFLGDMFEVGTTAHTEHELTVRIAVSLGIDEIYLVGKDFSRVASLGDHVHTFKTFDDFQNSFEGISAFSGQTAILIKGSRGMAMERVLDLL